MLQAIITTIVDSVKGFAGGLGEGTVDFFESIFVTVTGDTQGISTLGIFIMCMVGLTLSLAIIRWVSSLVRGNR